MSLPDPDVSQRSGKTTVHLPYALRRWYKVYAAEHDTTMGSVIESVLVAFAREHGYKPDPHERDINASDNDDNA